MLAIGYGTVGYWLVEGKSLLDAFYETVLTLSTVGVGAGPPPGAGGKIFTVSLILFGVVALFTAIGVGTEVVASGELGRWLRMNQVTRSIGHLSGHYRSWSRCWKNTASRTYQATRPTRPCSRRPASSAPGA